VATRHQVRESVVSLLYAKDIGNDDIDEFLNDIFEDKKIRNRQREFAINLYSGVMKNLQEIDSKINEHLKEWKIDDLGNIERAILRLGAYEILFSDIDDAVVINEAIELSKSLASDSAPKFVNGVLDALVKKKAKS
jgi:N utilization substance protein B